jgi:tetratricopeptide (TPR) repeat protein
MQEYLDTITKLLQTSDGQEDIAFPSGVLARYVRDGKNVQAASYVNKYLESFPDNRKANLFKKKLSEPDPVNVSKERLKQLLEELLAESDKLSDVIALVKHYRLNDQQDEVIQTFEKAFQMAPDDKNVIALGFDIALQSDDEDMAEKMLKAAQDENIDNGSGLTYAARFCMHKEDYQAALKKVDEYIKLVPVSSYAYLLRSDINDKLGLFEDAITDIETAKRFNPVNPEVAKKYVALLYAEHLRSGSSSSPRQRDVINKAFVRAMGLKTGDRQLRGVYASFVAEEDPERALSINQQLMKQAPSVKNALALSRIAMSIAQKEYDQGQREAKLEIAEWACQEALKLEPDNKLALQSYSNVLRLLGRQDEAASLLEGKHGQLWRFYLRDSQYDKAKEVLMELYQDDSQDTDILKGLILVAKNAEDKDSIIKYSEELLAADNTPENELLQIQVYLQTGLIEEGSLKLASFRERNPQNSQAMLLETESMMKKGHLDEALELANRNLEMDPENALSWRLRGRVKASLGDYDQAISDYQKSKSLNETVQIRMDLARIYKRVGKLTEAMGELTTVFQSAQAPRKAILMLEALYKQTGKVEELEKFYGQMLEKYPGSNYWLTQAGKFYSQRKDFGQAEKLLERAWQLSLERTGGKMQVLDVYLEVLDQAGKLDRLQAVASKYIDTKFAPIAYSYVAKAKVQMGSRATAVEYYRKALDKSAGNETLIYGVLMNMSETVGVAESKRWCNEKLVEDPDSLPVIMVLFKICSMRGELNKAKEYIDRAIDVVESDDNRKLPADYLIEKANIHLRQYMKTSDKQYFNESVSVFEKLLVEQPGNLSALNNLAYILVSNGEQLDRAVELAQKAHERAPNNTDYMDTYAYALCKTGNYEKAHQLLQRALQTFEMITREPSWDLYEHLGMAQRGIGAIADARNSYERALNRAGDNISEEDKERLQKAIEQLTE